MNEPDDTSIRDKEIPLTRVPPQYHGHLAAGQRVHDVAFLNPWPCMTDVPVPRSRNWQFCQMLAFKQEFDTPVSAVLMPIECAVSENLCPDSSFQLP